MNKTPFFPFFVGVPALIWQGLFFYLPLTFLLLSSLCNLSFSSPEISLEKIFYFLKPIYFKVIGSSLLLAFSTALICLSLAYPLSYFLSLCGKKMKTLLLFLLLIPFWTNFLLHVYAWFYLLENQGTLNNVLLALKIIQEPIRPLNSLFAIMIMMVYYYLPFMVLPLYSSLERFNPTLIEASLDLGASWFHTFRRILLPLTMRGVRAGFLLVYVPSFGEFAIPELMGGNKQMFVGNVVSEYLLAEGAGSLGAAFTVISSACLLLTLFFLYWQSNRWIPK